MVNQDKDTSSQTDWRTDRRQYHVNSRSQCVHQFDRLKITTGNACEYRDELIDYEIIGE